MESLNFMSKGDTPSVKILEEMFRPKDNSVWFVESVKTKKWVNVYDNLFDDNSLTNNPNEARHFQTRIQAMTFIFKNKLGGDFNPTEHQFIDKTTK
jgi:hypothetical protein